MFSFAPLKSHI